MTAQAHPAPRPTYLRELGIGVLLYLVPAAILRWVPLPFTIPSRFDTAAAALAVATMIVFGLPIYLSLRRRPPGTRLPAAAALVLPILLGDALDAAAFAWLYPRFDPAAAAVFATILFLATFAGLAAGWLAEQAT